ncbi:Interferon-induced very large GTPase 1 [Holothuria leucospilota]|uniref:Interferon-induced very large GTPase 1 n=1 Tax=Holothuria leucospilota TaxID=206669 RepID=A0A9Q0YFK8_HOLLE|nr:Interferon-induced very large GTPase 1 [Holothuria leucospilota]
MDDQAKSSEKPFPSTESNTEKGKSISKLPLRGILLTSNDDKGLIKPRGTLANISVQEVKTSHHDKIRSETRKFFDKQSEDIFLSLCAQGYNSALAESLPGQSGKSEWPSEGTQYMSKVKHTWYLEKWFEMKSGTHLQLSQEAIESLKSISSKLKSSNQDISKEDIKGDVSTFLSEFGSHVSLGPFVIGGRSVERVSFSDCKDLDKKEIWNHLEAEFNNMNPQDVDICSAGGDAHLVTIKRQGRDDEIVEFTRQIQLFGGDKDPSDFDKWREDLVSSSLVISGVVSLENVQAVWDILSKHEEIFGESYESLSCLLQETWTQENGVSNASDFKDEDAQLPKENRPDSDAESDEYETASDEDTFESKDKKAMKVPEILQKLHLSRKTYSLSASNVLRKDALEDRDISKDVMWKFLRSINSLDYRGRKCIKLRTQNLNEDNGNSENSESDIFAEVDPTESGLDSQNSIISAMDVTFAILHCCNPFLRQELLWKMVECRLAVPILLPGLDNRESIEFQLWGLRKIYKTWKSRVMNETPLERSVVSHPLPIVTFLRFGRLNFSKSKLINKIVGKLQGNNDHSLFVDVEEEPPCAIWSKGTLEVAWFLPEGACDEKDPNALLDAITFFNLRGDAMDYPVQKEFACRASDIVVALIEKSKYSECRRQIQDISEKMAKHLVCVISSSDHQKEGTIKRQRNVTMIGSKRFLTDIGADICQEINTILWNPGKNSEAQSGFKNIQSLTDLCSDLNIQVDERNKWCIEAKQLAESVVKNIHRSSETYKAKYLPLQEKLWKEWSTLDKKWGKGYGHQRFDSIEHYHDYLKQEMLKVREKQRDTQPSDDIVTVVDALKRSREQRQYFVSWLNFYLNDLSQEKLGPLRKELRDIQNKSREINAEKSKVKDKPEISSEDKAQLEKLNNEDVVLLKRAQDITSAIDSGSLGMEHYMRELGQRFEAYEDLRGENETDVDSRINAGTLPDIAADLLINGHPLEILDGDVGRVPIKWVQAVFKSVKEKLGNDATVCVISVLGIQSSGKSTLLNSMFGVRFAVSAGRCTRGVFIQLLKVHEDLGKETGCNYVIVIDTEGLKAPERSFRDDFRHDNELATFALCLADLTLINIAGQTVGKDMTDVLQIAAHAFIRMKEVRIKSSCRIIQQFVADLAAVDKNEACTLAILTNLDEAIAAAAKDEGYGAFYTRFSDVFNLKRNEDIQYIPSLWQGSMAPPNHRYSERIMQLKKVIIDDLRQSSRTFEQFAERITIVWNAVKEENFIFSFQNCVIALRYKTFQHAYGKWVGEMRQAVMEWESNAKQLLKNVSKDRLDETKGTLVKEIAKVVDREGERIEQQILAYLQENVTDDEDQLHKFQDEFLHDLELTQRNFTQDARETLNRTADSIAQLKHMDVLLPRCKNQLREKARTQAVELRKKHANAASIETVISEKEINTKFEELWGTWIKEICDMYPTRQVSMDDVEREFDSYLIRQGEKKDLSKVVKKKLGISRYKLLRKVASQFHGSQEDVVRTIIENSLGTLQIDIADDLAFDPVIIQKLIDTTIDALNNKYDGTTLTQEDKSNAIVEVCDRAVPLIFKGRQLYNSKYSLRELLTKEKDTLKKDFQALCSNAFQDQRASESLTSLLNEKLVEIVRNYLGPAIYKAVRELCSFFSSKFAMFGYVLEDMAQKEEFNSYYKFFFELENFLEEWSLNRIAEVCSKTDNNGKSFVENMVHEKLEEMLQKLSLSVKSTMIKSVMHEKNGREGKDEGVRKLLTWINRFRDELRKNLPTLNLSADDEKNLLLFNVQDTAFFGEQVKAYVEQQMMEDIVNELQLPPKGKIKATKKMLLRLPTKPHKEIKKHVSGCTEQCPICHVPCDNMTKQHEKHRAELHYPEGLVGCAAAKDDCLACSICTSSVTTDERYWDGQVSRRYCDYQKDFPSWVIQPIQNDTPLKYWKWVMNRFNEDFARLYGRQEAKLPFGWTIITKDQALEDLREAYVTKRMGQP